MTLCLQTLMIQSKKALLQAMAELNPRQKQAVEQIDGPMMVLAGPGTGKTQVLTLRIAYILQETDIKPANILGLTYTDTAAVTMRERLAGLIGSDAYRVALCTFHSFCAQVMGEHPELFPIEPQTEPISDWEAYSLISDLLTDLDLKKLRPINKPLLYVKDILAAISDLKKEGVDVVRYKHLIAEEWADLPKTATQATRLKFMADLAKNQELCLIYERYQAELAKLGRHDFDDMIAWVVQALQTNAELLIEYQERYHYLLVDEYQDTNTAQNLIVDKLAQFWGDRANLCVVGDPNQAIYRFQGASLENTLGFLQRYPQAEVVQLADGYRCSQEIYNASASLLNQSVHEGVLNLSTKVRQIIQTNSQPLTSVRGPVQLPGLITAPTDLNETTQVIAQIKQRLATGTASDQIAILCRTNREARIWHDNLLRAEVPAILSVGADVLQDPVVAGLLKLCQLIVGWREGDETGLSEVLYLPWLNLPHLAIMKWARLATKARRGLIATLAELPTTDSATPQLSPPELQSLRQFVTRLEAWGRQDLQQTLPEFLAQLMADVNLLEFIRRQTDRWERLHALTTLFEYAKTFARTRSVHLADLTSHIQTLVDHNLNLTAQPLPQIYKAVAVMTAHGAKGKEWDCVWIVGLDTGWGSRRSSEKIALPKNILRYSQLTTAEKEDDERRLLYVAMTRARVQLTLSFAQVVASATKPKNQVASQFLAELRSQQPPVLTDLSLPDLTYQSVEQQLLPVKKYSVDQKHFFTQLLQDFALSVTALDKYLRDPADFIWDVLLRFPKAKAPVMAYGSAIHAGLETLYRSVITHQRYAELSDVLQIYEKRLQNEILTPEEFGRRLTLGQTTLRHYHNFLTAQLPPVVEVERFFGSGLRRPRLGHIKLSGRIDRIDLTDAKTQSAKVIDYKTGAVKSLNAICGLANTTDYSPRELALPESIRGQYKRQLVFYKLLCQLDTTCPYQVDSGAFVFLKPCETGKPSQERQLNLSEDDVGDLTKLIQEVMAEINALAFLQYLPATDSDQLSAD